MSKKKKDKRRKVYTAKGVKLVKPKKRINSCAKGKVGERELVNFLKERGILGRRGQQYEGSSDSPDVIAHGCLTGFHLEVKRVQAGSLYSWLDQACKDADLAKVPVVAHRRNNKRWVAILDLRDFVNLVEQACGSRKQD